MRSVFTLAALAFSAFHLTSAGLCVPKHPTTTPTTTPITRSIKNLIGNGNFAIRDPSNPARVLGYNITGQVDRNTQQGYTGDGSTTPGCAQMQAASQNTPALRHKRAVGGSAGISQYVTGMDVSTLYTVRFFYAVITAPASLNICWIDAFLGSQNFFTTFIFGTGQGIVWGTVLTQTNTPASGAPLSISVNCISGGIAMIYVDSIFMSNQVTPQNIDDFQLDYGDESDVPDTATTATNLPEDGTSTPGSTGSSTASASETTELASTSQEGTSSSGEPETTPAGAGTPSSGPGGGVGSTPTNTPSSPSTETGLQPVTGTPSSREPETTPAGAGTPGSGSIDTGSLTPQPVTGTPISVTPRSSSTDAGSHAPQPVTETPGSGGSSNSANPTPSDTTSAPTPLSTSKVCVYLSDPLTAGRGCGKKPSSSHGGYSSFRTSTITERECAALCFADENCLSFEYTYAGQGCANDCLLIASPLLDASPDDGDAIMAYDRSCIRKYDCPNWWPDNAICINGAGNTPRAGCQQRRGSLKSCAQHFATLTISDVDESCTLTRGCRDMCSMYPSCKAFRLTDALSNNCFLYAGTVSQIAGPGDDAWFEDLSCSDCGQNMGYFTYALPLEDPLDMPEMTCEDTPSQPSSSTTPTNTPTNTPATNPTTTAEPSATASVCLIPEGGRCTKKSPAPNGLLCSVDGDNFPTGFGYYRFVTSEEECAAICYQDPTCKTSGWQNNANICRFQDASLAELDFVPVVGGVTVFSDPQCWDCPCQSELTPTTTAVPTYTYDPDLPKCTTALNDGCPWVPGLDGNQQYACTKNGHFPNFEYYTIDRSIYPNQYGPYFCAAICNQMPTRCQSWAFTGTSCRFSRFANDDAAFVVGNEWNDNMWYDQSCFQCPSCDEDAVTTPATTPIAINPTPNPTYL